MRHGIANFNRLPPVIRSLVQTADATSPGLFQGLQGYAGTLRVWEAEGSWDGDTFQMSSITGTLYNMKIHWRENYGVDINVRE